MNDDVKQRRAPERLAALRCLPKDLLDRLSREEIHSFLHDEVWPDSLREKLKDHIVEEDDAHSS